MRKWVFMACVVLAAALALSACGGNGGKDSGAPSNSSAASDASGAGAAKTIAVNAKNFEFDQKEIKVAKGDTVTIKLVNAQGNHSLKVDGYELEAKGGKSITFTADKAGEFKFYCNVMCGSGHGDMAGKLIVE